MSANAPYVQLRRQFTNGTNAQFAPNDDEYDLASLNAPYVESCHIEVQSTDSQNVVDLLEVTTPAAGHAIPVMNAGGMPSRRVTQGRGKRKRGSSPQVNEAVDSVELHENGPSKRPRIDMSSYFDPKTQNDDVQAARHVNDLSPAMEPLLVDAHAPGVHSAAALFRRRSKKEPAGKYTRPPMSKLFMSLQITPENFLHLQARAKTYMLDQTHPERQSCVGNRGKGDTDMVKLRLFNCVRDFLSDGAGEQFFGEDVETPGRRDAAEAARALGQENITMEGKLTWPRDGNKIISLVTPLLRRMVTNERQRMYAIETRKGGTKKDGSVEGAPQVELDPTSNAANDHVSELQPLQKAFEAAASQSLAHASAQIPYSHATSPPRSLPTHCSSHLDQHSHYVMSSSDTEEYEMRTLKHLPLPNEPYFDLHCIRICLARKGFRLKGRKKIKGLKLENIDFKIVLAHIETMLREALLVYPELRHPPLDEQLQIIHRMAPEALRGLAVAATEMDCNVESAAEKGTSRADTIEASDSVFDPSSSSANPAEHPPVTWQTEGAGSYTLLPTPALPGEAPVSLGPSGIVQPASNHITDTRRGHLLSKNASHSSLLSKVNQSSQQCRDSLDNLPKKVSLPSLTNGSNDSSDTVSSVGGLAPKSPRQSSSSNEFVTSSSYDPLLSLGPESDLPRIQVYVMTTTGLMTIASDEDWVRAKRDVGHAAWAMGSMNVLVELQ